MQGEIPSGYVVHHIDGNRMNDDPSNLACIPRVGHAKVHEVGTNKIAREKQKETMKRKHADPIFHAKQKAIWKTRSEKREYRDKLSKSLMGHIGANKRKCVCIESGEIFNSLTEACNKYGEAVMGCVRNPTRCKTAYGLHWAYYDPIDELGNGLD